MIYLMSLILGYFLGSIPFGLIFAHIAGLGDVRTVGSGNIGATNVLRTGNKMVALVTLLADMLKASVAVWLSVWLFHSDICGLIAGFFAFIGHCFPIWLKFKGGKGVASYIGVLLAIFWPAALVFAATWIIIAILWRYSSLAALVASSIIPLFMVLVDKPLMSLTCTLMALMIVYRHRENIQRLRDRTESKIGQKGQ